MIQNLEKCLICYQSISANQKIVLQCQHSFCKTCLKTKIKYLRQNRELKPETLICNYQECMQQYPQNLIKILCQPSEAMIINIIKKKYKELKDPNAVIFVCQGFLTKIRKSLIEKKGETSREQHSLLVNPIARQIINNKQQNEYLRCTTIFSGHKFKQSKDKYMLCYQCGCSYCTKCFEFAHIGSCAKKQQIIPISSKSESPEQFETFLNTNEISRCVNPKCQLPITKEAGCYFVKCICKWQMCYPCKVIWGNCQHFAKYPYKKFTPPPEWLERALKLF